MSSPNQPNGKKVRAPSGSNFYVLTDEEMDYFQNRSKRYTSDNHFTNVTDLQDLDRLLMMELMVWRWGQWLASEEDYDGVNVDTDELQKQLREYSTEIRQIKKILGIDKVTRDKEKGESVADYLENLRMRAKEFGYARNKQSVAAITLFKELQSLITLHDNCNERERREQHIEMHDIIAWLKEIAFPEFDKIDEEFKKTSQTYWIREM